MLQEVLRKFQMVGQMEEHVALPKIAKEQLRGNEITAIARFEGENLLLAQKTS